MSLSERMQSITKKRGSLTNLGVQLPNGLLREIDNLVAKGLYLSRSEAIREAMRILIYLERGTLQDVF